MQVITPVRRSARKSAATPLIASMLWETEFAYAPNEALSCRRHPIFDTPAAVPEAAADPVQQEDDDASTPTSITGSCTTLHANGPTRTVTCNKDGLTLFLRSSKNV